MRTLALLIGLLCAPLARAGTVDVVFEQPDRYSDAGWGADAEAHRQTLTQHLQRLGAQGLPPQQMLHIVVTDIDLAGRTRPELAQRPDLRVLDGRTDWPRIALRYTLSEDGRVLREGREQLSDMAYLDHLPRPTSGEPLPYERRLLDDWFRARFGADAGQH